jgi:hypothetical protein
VTPAPGDVVTNGRREWRVAISRVKLSSGGS